MVVLTHFSILKSDMYWGHSEKLFDNTTLHEFLYILKMKNISDAKFLAEYQNCMKLKYCKIRGCIFFMTYKMAFTIDEL